MGQIYSLPFKCLIIDSVLHSCFQSGGGGRGGGLQYMQLGRELKNIFLAKLHFLKNEAGGGGGGGTLIPNPPSPIPILWTLPIYMGPGGFSLLHF